MGPKIKPGDGVRQTKGPFGGPGFSRTKTGKLDSNFPVISVGYLASPRGFEPLSPA